MAKSPEGHEGVIFITDIHPRNKQYVPNRDFHFLRKLGSGSQGIVYLAQDAFNFKKFAVKKTGLIHFSGEELELSCNLWHENVIKIYGVIRSEDHLYILMEYIDGISVNTFIKSINSLEEYQALYYAYEIFSALDYFQSVGVIHGDIKAANVMVSSDGLRLVVIDFGLARRIPHGKEVICNNKIMTGTPTHWSPEIAKNEQFDFRSDVWAAMCFLIHLLTGSHPWIKRVRDIEALQYFIANYSPPLVDIPINVSTKLKQFFLRGFTVDYKKRPFAREMQNEEVFVDYFDDTEDADLNPDIINAYEKIPTSKNICESFKESYRFTKSLRSLKNLGNSNNVTSELRTTSIYARSIRISYPKNSTY